MSVAVKQPVVDTFSIAESYVKTLYDNVAWGANSAYVIVRNDGTVVSQYGDACFYALSEESYEIYEREEEEDVWYEDGELVDSGLWIPAGTRLDYGVFFTTMLYEDIDNPPEYALAFVDYVANRSVYADVFYTKDARKIIQRPYILHTHFPAAMVIGAAANIRYFVDHPNIPRCFFDLVKEGVDENIAHLLAQAVRNGGNGQWDFDTVASWHSAFGIGFDKFMAQNFLNRKWDKGLPLFAESTIYSPLNRLWGKCEDDTWAASEKESFVFSPNGYSLKRYGGYIETTLGTQIKLPGPAGAELKDYADKVVERIFA